MYKKFYSYIKNLSLVIGYLNLLRSFYQDGGNGKNNDAEIADRMIYEFKDLCKAIVREVEKLIEHQQSEISLTDKKLAEIEKMIGSFSKPLVQSRLSEITDGLNNVKEFITFLINEFPNKTIDRVDLRDIRTEVLLFKYQVYMS